MNVIEFCLQQECSKKVQRAIEDSDYTLEDINSKLQNANCKNLNVVSHSCGVYEIACTVHFKTGELWTYSPAFFYDLTVHFVPDHVFSFSYGTGGISRSRRKENFVPINRLSPFSEQGKCVRDIGRYHK